MSNRINNMVVWIAALVVTSSACLASPVLPFSQSWTNSGTASWTNDGGATVDNPNTNALRIAFGSGPGSSYIYGTGGTNGQYGGDFKAPAGTNLTVSFKFITGADTPGALYLAFQSGGEMWRYNLLASDPIAANSTNQISSKVLSSYSTQWGGFGNINSTQYAADIGAVDWIGIYVANSGFGAQTYWLDDWTYGYEPVPVPVPEPETVWMILAVVMSIGITFRSRLVDTMNQMKTRFTKV